MTLKKISPLAALLMSTAPAFADLTAQDAWEMMQKYGEDGGLAVTVGNEQETATGLIVTNLRYGMEVPDVSMVMQIDEIIFDELDDGSVRTTVSDIPFAMTLAAEGEVVEVVGQFTMPGGESIVSGDPGDYSMIMEYPTMTFTLDSVVVDGQEVPIESFLRMDNVKGFMAVTEIEGQLPEQSSQYTIDKVTFDLDIEVPEEEGGGRIVANAQFDDFDMLGSGNIAPFDGSAFPEGLVSNSKLNRGASAITVAIDSPDGQVNVEISDQNGSLTAGVEDGNISYENKANGTRIAVSGNAIPLPPIEIGIASTGLSLTAPIQPSPDERPFRMAMDISGLVISDFLWSMVDPFNNLPHDPADIAFDISGTGKLSVDVFDPDFNPEAMTTAPGSLSGIAIDNFLLSAVGAKLTAKGSAQNMEDNPLAMPKMAGAMDVTANGIQGLMENLGKMGVLPVQQAGMANMMLGMFAVPGAEPDSFTSHIQLNEDGGILVNGQPVR